MTLLYMESFHHTGRNVDYAAADINMDKYNTSYAAWDHPVLGDGPRSNWGYYSWSATGRYLEKTLPSLTDPVYMGFAHIPYLSSHGGWRFYNADGLQCMVDISDSGSVRAYRGDRSSLLGSTALRTIETNLWYYFEVKAIVHPTAGEITVRLNGTQILNLTSQNTQNSGTSNGTTYVRLYALYHYTDWYIDDSQFHGVCRVDCLYPDGAGSNADMSPSAGNNYECVDEQGNYNEDSDYVTGDVLNDKDSYSFANIPSLSGSTIFGLAVNNVVKKTDVNTVKIKNLVRSNGADYLETSEYDLTQNDYKAHQAIWELNPDDSAAWEEADVNAAEAGLQLTTV